MANGTGPLEDRPIERDPELEDAGTAAEPTLADEVVDAELDRVQDEALDGADSIDDVVDEELDEAQDAVLGEVIDPDRRGDGDRL